MSNSFGKRNARPVPPTKPPAWPVRKGASEPPPVERRSASREISNGMQVALDTPSRFEVPSFDAVSKHYEAEATGEPIDGGFRFHPPLMTFGIVALLAAVFVMEQHFAIDGVGGDLGSHSFIALGGVSRTLVLKDHEWWRIFTAPLLHGGVSHVAGNCVALLFAGFALEPIIGARWYACVFMVSAIAGSILSMMSAASPDIVSVGASGAIAGLLACSLTCSFHFESAKLRKRMQKYTLRWMIMAFLPAILPEADSTGPVTDIACHLGGAIAGGLMGTLLGGIWPEGKRTPTFATGAFMFACGSLAVAFLGFVLTAQTFHTHVQETSQFMVERDEPQSLDEAVRRSADLVSRFPSDPRSHFYRAFFFIQTKDLVGAKDELNTAEADLNRVPMRPQFAQSIKMLKAMLLYDQGRKADAKAAARPVCGVALRDDNTKKLHGILETYGICS